MKIFYNYNPWQHGAGWGRGRGWGGVGRSGSKKSKPNPALPCGVELKSCPIVAPPPLRGGENLSGAKRVGAG